MLKELFWLHRLVARTPGSHPGNRGSIPLGATSKIKRIFINRITDGNC